MSTSPPLALLLLMLCPCSALVAPNTSLARIPVAYFGGKGGNSGPRSAANIAMLAKMRIVMLEKWEGPCWDDCLANATGEPPLPCQPACNVEADMLDTLHRVRALNSRVTNVLYLNTLLLFPFYSLAQKYIDAGALLMDTETGQPVTLRNDDGMPGVLVPDFGTAKGRALWMGEVKDWVGTGVVDGIFADKWPDSAHQNKLGTWKVCNHVCGTVSAADGAAFNAGKLQLRENVSSYFHVESRSPETYGGLLYGDGCDGCERRSPRIDGNLLGPWIKNWQFTPTTGKKGPQPGQNIWKMIQMTHDLLHVYNYTYVLVGCGDHHPSGGSSGGKPFNHNCTDDLCTDCTPEGIAIYLLVVEEGVFLGGNGWAPEFDKPLGAPLGPAKNETDASGAVVGLSRSFESGTHVTYNLSCVNSPPRQEGYGCSTITWGDTGD